MPKKIFIGTVEKNEHEEWGSKKEEGTIVSCQKFEISLSEDAGKAFNVYPENPKYEKVKAIPLGTRVKITAGSQLRMDGGYNWLLEDVEPAGPGIL